MLDFRSDFGENVVTALYCPKCTDRAPGNALIFDLCEPGEVAGTWAVEYNPGMLKHLDTNFHDDDGYYLSLLISGMCAPEVIRTHYRGGGVCRIVGFKHGPDVSREESTLSSKEHQLAEENDRSPAESNIELPEMKRRQPRTKKTPKK